MGRPASTWTKDRAETVLKLGEQGLSMRDIAERMGLTRNSVIGQLNRMRKAEASTPRPTVRDPEYHHKLADSLSRSDTCRYPSGDYRMQSLKFCGRQVAIEGVSYCEEHLARCTARPWVQKVSDNNPNRPESVAGSDG